MKRASLKGLGGVLLLSALSTVGCCAQHKAQISRLNRRIGDLGTKNTRLQAELVMATNRGHELDRQLKEQGRKDARLAAALMEIERLQGQRTATEGRSALGTVGRETTVYARAIGTDILFGAGQATLTGAGRNRINKIAAEIKSKYPGMTVRVYGHTDTDPIRKSRKLWKDNLDLSANRAMSVTRYLIGKGIGRGRLETVAMGAARPIKTSAGKTDGARSRRVEIRVIKQ